MKLLLDTHTFVWMVNDFDRLPPNAQLAVDDAPNDLYLSAASVWELAIKVSIGKMNFNRDLARMIHDGSIQVEAKSLPVTFDHALAVQALPHHHNDPFDRIPIAQAMVESMTIVTVDKAMSAYGIPTIC